ncbi:MAG: hypothetical protein QOI73_739 [Solirubrobacteraceae bacterium]|nr:hypothetical protein [Solirubrobacteraceae bacterium]
MNTSDDALTAISGLTDDEITRDSVRAASVLYAAATLEELSLIELVERLNELNQNKMLSIGAGDASNMLHEFWDSGYKRMPAKRRAALYARVFGWPAGHDESNDAFGPLWGALLTAISDGEADAIGAAATALRENLDENTDDKTSAAAVELRSTFAAISDVLSDMELRSAYGSADDMWQVFERASAELGGGPSVAGPRDRALSGALILRNLQELSDGSAAGADVAEAARTWLHADARDA